MRHLLITAALVACIAAPSTFAQGRPGGAGGPPSAGGMGGPPSGMSGSRPTSGPSIDMRANAETRRAEAAARRLEAQTRRAEADTRRAEAAARRDAAAANAQTPEEAQFGLDTAARAQALKDADQETREAFGAKQAELAQGQGQSEGEGDDDE